MDWVKTHDLSSDIFAVLYTISCYIISRCNDNASRLHSPIRSMLGQLWLLVSILSQMPGNRLTLVCITNPWNMYTKLFWLVLVWIISIFPGAFRWVTCTFFLLSWPPYHYTLSFFVQNMISFRLYPERKILEQNVGDHAYENVMSGVMSLFI